MWHSVNSAKTMKMLDRWVNPDYDGRYKHGPHSLKSLEEGDLIEVWDRTDDPDDIRFYLKPHKTILQVGKGGIHCPCQCCSPPPGEGRRKILRSARRAANEFAIREGLEDHRDPYVPGDDMDERFWQFKLEAEYGEE